MNESTNQRIKSTKVIQSRFKSNRDLDLPITECRSVLPGNGRWITNLRQHTL